MKIPVGKTIAYACSFTVGNLLTLIGLSWVAQLISTAATYFLMPPYFRALAQATATEGAAGIGPAVSYILSFSVLAFLSVGMISIAFARHRTDEPLRTS